MKKLETTLAGWMKHVPHLPKNAVEWIARNIWWIILIVTLLQIVSVAFSLLVTVVASLADSIRVGFLAGISTGLYGILNSIAGAILVVIYLMAITPLNQRAKRGWDLVFLATVLSLVFHVVISIVTVSQQVFLGQVIGAIASLYLLFEIRSHFSGQKRNHHKEVIDL